MTARVIEIDNLPSAEKEMLSIGSDRVGINLMLSKAVSRVLKLKDIRPVAANIIKQEMLSFGGEAATAYGAINQSVKQTDVLIFGNLRQLNNLVKKLKLHQFGLPKVADEIERTLNSCENVPKPVKIGGRVLDFGHRTYVMGILNVTPDSFSDGGKFYRVENAVKRGQKMAEEGADVIDVGGESTRPSAHPVQAREEMERVVPVIKKLAKDRKIVISIDTRKARVAQAALDAGADMVNDVSGLRFDKKMARVVDEYKVPVCIMHMRGTPQTMQNKPEYKDLISDIIFYLTESVELAKKAGIPEKQLIIDPGIGFGKTVEHNLEIFRRLREFKSLGLPILIGPSRKSVIGKVLDLPVEERLEGTAALVALAIANGADIIRVHDVKEMVRVARMTDAIVRRN